jgi:hypothetical protein
LAHVVAHWRAGTRLDGARSTEVAPLPTSRNAIRVLSILVGLACACGPTAPDGDADDADGDGKADLLGPDQDKDGISDAREGRGDLVDSDVLCFDVVPRQNSTVPATEEPQVYAPGSA